MKHEDATPRKGLLERLGLLGECCLAREVTMILLQDASLCASCDAIVQATSDSCPACAARGSLLSLAAVLNRQPLEEVAPAPRRAVEIPVPFERNHDSQDFYPALPWPGVAYEWDESGNSL
jgi:hypothetical protein